MKQNIIHIGLDVDDTQYHRAAFNKETGEVIEFKSRPTLKGLLEQLDRMARHFKGHKIKLCYEASYVGYCLQRDLISSDIHCDIVSPSSIPSPRGKAIKTGRIDAGYLAQFYANDLLTIVQPPDEEQEQDRDLLRLRQKVMQQRNQLRKHLQSASPARRFLPASRNSFDQR
jgi:transposase